jgi:hypothetical protein
MDCTAQIKLEFVKQARKWNDLTRDEQKKYLKKHPGSKRRLTAGPELQKSRAKSKALETAKSVKRLFSRVKKLDAFSTRVENIKSWSKRINLKRTKIFWKLEKALEGRRPSGSDPYTLDNTYASSQQKARNARVTKKLNRLIGRIADAYERLPTNKETKQQVIDYIKKHYLVERKIEVPNRVEDVKKELPKAKVKKIKTPEFVGVGDRVRLSNGIEVTVVDVKHGHKWVTVNGDTDDGAHWHSKQRSSLYSGGNLKFLGKALERDKKKHITNRRDYDRSIQDDKTKMKVQGQKTLEQLGVDVGDTVEIKGTRYNWTAEVMSLDYRQGGVRINQLRQRHKRSWLGQGPSIGQPHYRFIPARFVVSVKK